MAASRGSSDTWTPDRLAEASSGAVRAGLNWLRLGLHGFAGPMGSKRSKALQPLYRPSLSPPAAASYLPSSCAAMSFCPSPPFAIFPRQMLSWLRRA